MRSPKLRAPEMDDKTILLYRILKKILATFNDASAHLGEWKFLLNLGLRNLFSAPKYST